MLQLLIQSVTDSQFDSRQCIPRFHVVEQVYFIMMFIEKNDSTFIVILAALRSSV